MPYAKDVDAKNNRVRDRLWRTVGVGPSSSYLVTGMWPNGAGI